MTLFNDFILYAIVTGEVQNGLSAAISLAVFSGVSIGIYSIGNSLLPGYRRYRTRVIRETLSSLDEQFLFLTPRQAGMIHILSTLIFSLIGAVVGLDRSWSGFLLAVLLFGAAGYHLPKLAIHFFFRKRLEKIERQIPDLLKMMFGSLRAGLSLSEAIKQAVREIPPPISHELGLVLKKIKMGESFEESLKFLDDRLRLEDLSLMVSAMILSNEAGGSLTPVLERLEETIEERTRLKGKINALTAQGKMQGWVVGLLPLILGGILFLIDPALMIPFWTTPAGGAGLLAIVLLEISGFWLIKKIVESGEV